VIIRGGSETYEPRNKFFFPKVEAVRDIDIVYIARFVNFKRYDIALKCVNYVKRHKPDCRAIFLEPGYSDAGASEWVAAEKIRLGLDNNLIITRGGWRKVNRILNRSRISLFTSDNEGMCRAVLESLLAERPVLCYRQTRAVIRLIYDSRYFHYYDEQTEESVGEAAWKLLQSGAETNQGARKYILKEKAMKFHDLIGWQSEVLNAARVLYARDGQRLEPNDIVPWNELSQDNRFWKEFELISD
jgi:glycosyltransferase involved in cell wall biosynthesis